MWKNMFLVCKLECVFPAKSYQFLIKNWKRKARNSLAAVAGRKKVDLASIQLCPSEK
jgi:hypothetical protein